MSRYKALLVAAAVAISSTCSAGNPFAKIKNLLSKPSTAKVVTADDSESAGYDTDEPTEELSNGTMGGLTDEMTNATVHTFRADDMTLMDLGWSLLNEKNLVETKFDKNYNLVIETKKDGAKAIVATDLPLVPEPGVHFCEDAKADDVAAVSVKTILQFFIDTKDLNNNSKFGVVVNYVDDENFDGILFDKKQYYLVNCKGGKMFYKRSGKRSFEVSPVRIKFENGKIDFYGYDKRYDNYLELWTVNGSLKSEYVGFIIVGKNRIAVSNVITVQDIPLEE